MISIDYGSFCNIIKCKFYNCGYGENGKAENNDTYQSISSSILQISGSSVVKMEETTIENCYSSESGILNK